MFYMRGKTVFTQCIPSRWISYQLLETTASFRHHSSLSRVKVSLSDCEGGYLPLSKHVGLDEHFLKSIGTQEIGNMSRKSGLTDPLYSLQATKEGLEAAQGELHALFSLFQTGEENIEAFEYDLLRLKAKHLNYLLDESKELPRSLSGNFNDDAWETFSVKELLDEIRRKEKSIGNPNSEIVALPLVNGINISLSYCGGVLVGGTVHELDEVPEGLMNLLRWLKGVPKIISMKKDITVRGVLTIRKSDFSKLNSERIANGKRHWFSPRSALLTAFTASNDPYKELESRIQCIFYGFTETNTSTRLSCKEYWPKADFRALTVSAMQHHLAEMGFSVFPQRSLLVRSLSQLQAELPSFIQFQTDRNQQTVNDGVVIRYDSFSEQNMLNQSGILFKHTPHFERTRVKNIDFGILPSGQIVANVFFDPVHLSGREVSKTILYTQEELTRIGVKKGDEVAVYLRNDTTPGILFSFKNTMSGVRALSPKLPTICPRCDASPKRTEWGKNSEAIFCSAHFVCVDDAPERLVRLGSAYGLNIPSLTMELAKELVKSGLVSSISDIFYLTESDENCINKVFKETYLRLLEEVKLSRKTTLDRFLFGMLWGNGTNTPSEDLGFAAAQEISHRFGTLANVMKASHTDFSGMKHVSKTVAKNVISFFIEQKNRREIDRCLSGGVIINEPREEIISISSMLPKNFSWRDYRSLIDKIIECEKDHHISDFEFDLLNNKANEIDLIHPEWKLPRIKAPTRKTITWTDPIKLTKTYSLNEMKKLLQNESAPFIVEPKVNGVACTLFYRNGLLHQAITKYDGRSGLDFTHRLRSAKNIPQKLKEATDIAVRGELFLPLAAFKNINEQRSSSAEKSPYKDSMSALLHVVNGKGRDIVMNESICFFPYHTNETHSLEGEVLHIPREDLYHHFTDLGFQMSDKPFHRTFEKADDLILWLSDAGARRMEYPFDIDGIVIKSCYAGASIEHSLAYKFSIENRTSTVKGLRFNICSNGFLRGLLEIKPVKFSNGRTVSSIALPNMRKVQSLHEGTPVVVKYTGGTHPTLDSIVESKKGQGPKITVPTECPHCEQTLEQTPSGNLRCINKLCQRQHSSSLEYFASKVGLSALSKELINNGVVSTPYDFYSLMPEDLHNIPHQKANDFIVSLNLSKKTPFPVFLRALKLGNTEKLSQVASSFSDLLNLDEEQLSSFNPELSKEFLSIIEKNKLHFKQLVDAGVCADSLVKSSEVFKKYEAYSARTKQIYAMSTDLFQLLNINERETRMDIASLDGKHETFASEWKREQNSLTAEDKKLTNALSRFLEHAKSRKTSTHAELSKLMTDENERSWWE
jgi:DNA ligase (NAD+)